MNDFDPWHAHDLIKFLRECAEIEDTEGAATAREVGQALGLDKDIAHRAQRRLTTLGLVEQIPDKRMRLSDGPGDEPLRLTAAGVHAVMNDRLPDA